MDIIDLLDYLDESEEIVHPIHHFRDRANPFEGYDDVTFKSRYKLSKNGFRDLITLLQDQLETSGRNHAIPTALQSTIDASTSTNVSPVNQEAPITVTSKISFIDDRTSEMPTGPSSALCNGSRAFSTSALDVTAPPLTVDEIGITGVISALASTPPALSSSRLFDRQYSAVDSSVCSQPHSSFDVLAPSISTPHLERGAMMMNAGVAPRGYPYHHNRPNFYHGIGNRFAYAPIVTSQASSVTCQTSRAPYSAGILYGSTAGASSSSSTTAVVSGVGGSAGSTGRSQADSVSVCGSASSSGLRTSKSRSSFVGMEEEADKNFYLKQSGSEYGMAKHLHTELVMSKHTLKGKMTKFQRLFDRAFSLIQLDTEDAILEGIGIVAKVMMNAWVVPKIGHDLAYGLCDYLREMGYFDTIIQFYLSTDTKERIRRSAGRALEECLSGPNRDYLVEKDMIDDLVNVSKSFKEGDELRVGVSLLESLFKQSSQTNSKLIEMGALDYVLDACKATTISQVFRHAALALANLSMYSENDCQQKMITKNVPDWLFLLASSQDDVTRYYACLAICALVSNKEIEVAVIKSGTLSLVEPFLLAHKPNDFANSDYRHNQGRPREWLEKLIPLLNAKRREPRSMAAFHFAMEAGIKKDQDQLEVFEEIGAIEILKQVASYPEEVAPKFATLALEIIGAEVPYKLSQQVPLWSVEDVQYWVTQIGFENYAIAFQEQKVDGDLLLLLTDKELEVDIDMKSSLLRKRFMRELDSLKIGADYSCIDETQLDRFLVSISPQLSIYTYQLLEKGADRSILPSISDDILKSDLGIRNPIDRFRLIQALEDCKHIDDMEIAILSRHIDIFISYRRSTGNQLASLIKVLLQLRGYKVFIDVDRLYAGKFDLSLLKNIQAAKHFILVLTPQALDRCCGDDQCHDWVHKEVLCAFEHNKNVIPIFDPQFEWPDENLLPGDIRVITRFNGVRWVHEYQDACVDKLEKFIKGELNLNRGFFPHQDRGSKRVPVNYRSNSSKQNSNPGTQSAQLTPSHSVADNLIETLSNHRSRTSSSEDILQAVITSNSHDLSTFEPIVDR